MRQFGPRAIPAYAAHLAQDFTTPQGIPLIPWAGAVYTLLVSTGIRKGRAATLLSVNLAGATAILGTVVITYEVACLLREVYRQRIASPSSVCTLNPTDHIHAHALSLSAPRHLGLR